MIRSSVAIAALAAIACVGCKDNDRFATDQASSFQGTVVRGTFVRAGIDEGTQLCLALDPNHLQDTPGSLWSSDGRFAATPLRPIPQLFHDPLSTLSFGEGRLQNLVYMVTPSDSSADVTVFLSLMEEGAVEVRLLRGAPNVGSPSPAAAPLFGVFSLAKHDDGCR